MKLKSVAICAFSAVLVGCTLPNSAISNPAPATGITGNWELTATTSTGGTNPIGIYLTQSGSTLSGIAWVQEAFPLCIGANGIPCAFPFGVINPNIAGTISADGNIVLGSTTGGTMPAVFSIAANTPTNSTLSGTYSITMGTATSSGTVTGTMIASLNGAYTGTVVSSYTGHSMGVTASLSQTTTPDATGFFRVNGSATFTGSACFTTTVMQGPAATYSGFLGSGFTVNLVSATNSNDFVVISGAVAPDAKTIQFHYGIVNLPGGTCSNDYGSGTLTRQ